MSHPVRILVVDDEALNRILLQTALEQVGYVVETVGDGRSALQVLHQLSFDLILLDLLLPDTSGEQILQQIKADAAWQPIPIIIISSLEQQEGIDRCLAMGAADFLPKPFNLEEIHRRVQAVL
jgi:DNA-binding response OmpR family regulator